MRSQPIFRSILIAGLSVLLVTACKTAKKSEDQGGAGEAGGQQPTTELPGGVASDKSMNSDPLGSDSGKIEGLHTVFFAYDKSSLSDDSRKKLAQNATWIKSNPNVTIQIEGHTDSRGSVEYNLALGERRAKSVKSYLQSLGVEAKRMTVISYGEEKPLVQGDGEEVWSKNRRANFVPIQ